MILAHQFLNRFKDAIIEANSSTIKHMNVILVLKIVIPALKNIFVQNAVQDSIFIKRILFQNVFRIVQLIFLIPNSGLILKQCGAINVHRIVSDAIIKVNAHNVMNLQF